MLVSPPSKGTGAELSKILGAKPKYWGKVVITDESKGVSQLLGARAQAAPPPQSLSLCLKVSAGSVRTPSDATAISPLKILCLDFYFSAALLR